MKKSPELVPSVLNLISLPYIDEAGKISTLPRFMKLAANCASYRRTWKRSHDRHRAVDSFFFLSLGERTFDCGDVGEHCFKRVHPFNHCCFCCGHVNHFLFVECGWSPKNHGTVCYRNTQHFSSFSLRGERGSKEEKLPLVKKSLRFTASFLRWPTSSHLCRFVLV